MAMSHGLSPGKRVTKSYTHSVYNSNAVKSLDWDSQDPTHTFLPGAKT